MELLATLEAEARAHFQAAAADPPRAVAPLSEPWFYLIIRQWQAWQNGVPPTREWLGYGGQNPYLLQAFEALDRARDTARQTSRPKEDPAAFAARIKAQVS